MFLIPWINLFLLKKSNQFGLPCPSFSIAAVMKTLNTCLKTWGSNIELGCPVPFQATIIMALTEEFKLLNIKATKVYKHAEGHKDGIRVWKSNHL